MANILTIIPYQFYPPIGGGAMRCFYILREMARNHNVYVLTSQPETDFLINNRLVFPTNVQVISTHKGRRYKSLFNILPAKLADALNFRLIVRSLIKPTNTTLLEVFPTLWDLLSSVEFDLFYYENLEALDLISQIIKRKNIKALHLYDAHNCDSELWTQQAAANSDKTKFRKYAAKALALEKSLYKRVDAFFCCSEDDEIKLKRLNENLIRGIVIPNGVDVSAKPFDNNVEKWSIQNIIFCGSLDYFPNKQGLLWFYNNVFPIIKCTFPLLTLTVVGIFSSMEDYKALVADTSVNFIGKVETVVPFYQNAAVAVVPLLSGSGTRLKILEAMSMGNPIVSTKIGAEGINYIEGEHILIADTPKEFAKQVISVLTNKALFDSLRINSLQLVQSNYDWHIIGHKVTQNLSSLLAGNRSNLFIKDNLKNQ
jgi:polysaccharide biosynthesis protein PslH